MDPPMDHSIEPKFTKLSKLLKNEVMQENKYCLPACYEIQELLNSKF